MDAALSVLDVFGVTKLAGMGLKALGKEVVEEIGEHAGKKVIEETGERLAKELAEEAGERIVKEVAGEAGERISREALEETGERLGREVAEETGEKISREAGAEAREKIAKEAIEEGREKAEKEIAQEVEAEVKEEVGEAVSERAKKTIADGVGESGLNPVDDIIRDGSHLENGKLKADVTYKTGEFDYTYKTDSKGRISNWSADDLQLTERAERLPHNPNTPGKIEGDHAGHLAGDRFGGSPKIDNLVSQSSSVNLSEYKKIENQWAKAISEGKKVTTNVEILYDGDSLRPKGFKVKYTIDGVAYSKRILN